MRGKPVWSQIVEDEALTRGLADPEARMLVEWLVDRAERLGEGPAVVRLRRRCRAVARFVRLWCHEGQRRSAIQLAGAERFDWPLPTGPADPCELMQEILGWEAEREAA
jgi:hypothetical protein